MVPFEHKHRFSLSLWLPVFATLISAAIVLVPAFRNYMKWKAAIGNSDKLVLTSANFKIMLPRQRMFRFAVESSAIREQGAISLLNAPGHLLGALASQLIAHHAYAFPDALGPFLWRVVSYPLFAIPAWFFAGRGLNGLLMRSRMRMHDLVLSLILTLMSLALWAGLRFGLYESEGARDELLISYIYGFLMWGLLFALPLAAWFLQRRNKTAFD